MKLLPHFLQSWSCWLRRQDSIQSQSLIVTKPGSTGRCSAEPTFVKVQRRPQGRHRGGQIDSGTVQPCCGAPATARCSGQGKNPTHCHHKKRWLVLLPKFHQRVTGSNLALRHGACVVPHFSSPPGRCISSQSHKKKGEHSAICWGGHYTDITIYSFIYLNPHLSIYLLI